MAPDKQSAVAPKTLSSVTQMLTTPNADTVMQGIELVRSLDDEALCEALLEGVVYESPVTGKRTDAWCRTRRSAGATRSNPV